MAGPPGTATAATTSPREATRVAIVDDHPLLSATLRAALEAEGFSATVPPLVDAEQMVDVVLAGQPQVVLLDLDLGPYGSGQDLLPGLVDAGMTVLLVSATSDEAVVGRALANGAVAWVSKGSELHILVEAVRGVVDGREVMPISQRHQLMEAWYLFKQQSEAQQALFQSLTRREAAVLSCLMRGLSVDRIASESVVSPLTVRAQVRSVLHKLGAKSQLEAVAMAFDARWQPPADRP